MSGVLLVGEVDEFYHQAISNDSKFVLLNRLHKVIGNG